MKVKLARSSCGRSFAQGKKDVDRDLCNGEKEMGMRKRRVREDRGEGPGGWALSSYFSAHENGTWRRCRRGAVEGRGGAQER